MNFCHLPEKKYLQENNYKLASKSFLCNMVFEKERKNHDHFRTKSFQRNSKCFFRKGATHTHVKKQTNSMLIFQRDLNEAYEAKIINASSYKCSLWVTCNQGDVTDIFHRLLLQSIDKKGLSKNCVLYFSQIYCKTFLDKNFKDFRNMSLIRFENSVQVCSVFISEYL